MQTIPPITLERTKELLEMSTDELDTMRIFLSHQSDLYDEIARTKGIGQEEMVNFLNTNTLHGEVCRIMMTKDMENGH